MMENKAQRPTMRPHEFWGISSYRDAKMQWKTWLKYQFISQLLNTEAYLTELQDGMKPSKDSFLSQAVWENLVSNDKEEETF